MKRGSMLALTVLVGMLSLFTGCKQGGGGPDLSGLGPTSAATTTILLAGSSQCPGGGIGIYSGSDGNADAVLDASEFQKGTPVCAPENKTGKPGNVGMLVMIVSEPSGTVHCPAGGLKVLSGPDENGNSVLDANEAAYTEYLCNGKPGSSSMAGITVNTGPVASEVGKKKGRKQASEKPKAGGKTADKAASKPVKQAKTESARPAASAVREKGSAPRPAAAPKGWNSAKSNAPGLAAVDYKIDGKYILLRFRNMSSTASVRCKYMVKWKVNQNGNWVEDSSTEGLSVRLRPQDTLDQEVRTHAEDIRDVVVDLDVTETT